MIYFLLLSYTILQSVFVLTHHPLMMCTVLVFLAMTTALMMMLETSKWLAMAIVLIFLGGMMVMFFYATSLSNNDKFFFKKSPVKLVFFSFVIWVFYSLMNKHYILPQLSGFTSNLYSHSTLFLIFSLMFYLLLGLFYIVKLTFNFEGSLIKKF